MKSWSCRHQLVSVLPMQEGKTKTLTDPSKKPRADLKIGYMALSSSLEQFAHGQTSYEKIPPLEAAVQQHVKRAILQGDIWGQCLVPRTVISHPQQWRWTRKRLWTMETKLDMPARGFQELPRSYRCKCRPDVGCHYHWGCKQRVQMCSSASCLCQWAVDNFLFILNIEDMII